MITVYLIVNRQALTPLNCTRNLVSIDIKFPNLRIAHNNGNAFWDVSDNYYIDQITVNFLVEKQGCCLTSAL